MNNKIIAEVIAGNMTVVSPGITSEILPGIDDSKVPGFYMDPIGPHSVGNFKVWVPREYLADMMSFMMLNRGDLVNKIYYRNLNTQGKLNSKLLLKKLTNFFINTSFL